MRNFSEEEVIQRKQQRGSSKIKTAAIAITFLLIFGLILDAFSGFYYMRNAKTSAIAIIGLLLLSVIYLVGEGVCSLIDSHDKVSDPLFIRVFRLLLMLLTVGAIMYVSWFLFRLLGW